MSHSMTSYVTFMTSQALRRRDVTNETDMEAKKEYQRFYIFARLQLGEIKQQIHSDLSKLFGLNIFYFEKFLFTTYILIISIH